MTDPYIQAFLTGATATDNIDGTISTITSFGPTTTYPVGTSTVVFAATDASGNSGTASATVTVADITPPTITITGANPITIAIGANYVDAGATAVDNFDGDVSGNITVSSTVNTAMPGSYTVSYAVSDLAGNPATATRQVVVVDQTPPVVTPPANITVQASSAAGVSASIVAIHTFLAAATAQDAIDGAIALVNNDAPATLPLGVHTITFSATDAAGNTGTAMASITVVDLTKPVLALQGTTPITVEAGMVYNDAGAIAVDNVDGNISSSIRVNNAVDVAVPGTYVVSYSVSDSSGNSSTLDRTVMVVDNTPPSIVVPKPTTIRVTGVKSIPSNSASVRAFLDGVLATDMVDGVVTVSPYNIPTQFALGVHQIVFHAVDAAGNIGRASSHLIVVDSAAPHDFVATVIDSYGASGSTVNVPIQLQVPVGMQITTFTIKLNFDGYALTPGQPVANALAGWTITKTGPVAAPVGSVSQVVISGQAPAGQLLGSNTTITLPFALSATLIDGYSYPMVIDRSSAGYTSSGVVVGMQAIDGTLRVGTLSLRQVTLQSGWNLIGISAIPGRHALEDLLQQSRADSVWGYSNNRWSSYLTILPKEMNTLKSLRQGRAYWLHCPGKGPAISITMKSFSGVTPGAASLGASGWQLIATRRPVTDVGAFVRNHSAASVWSYRYGQWQSYISGTPSFLNSLQSMQPGEGYYVWLP